jgi:hypothetical protein
MNGVIHGAIRQEEKRQPGCATASVTFISVHLDAFQFISVQSDMMLVLHHDSANGHHFVINMEFSERSDFDNSYPEGLLNGEKEKK